MRRAFIRGVLAVLDRVIGRLEIWRDWLDARYERYFPEPADGKRLTPEMITAKALVIMHQKLNMQGTINQKYEDIKSQHGIAPGASLRIRMPTDYKVTTTPT
jgi:hypothetical protein